MLNTSKNCIEYIHSLSKFGKKAGLKNTELILDRLGNPQKKLKFVHIAGTNGKGSVSNMINNILLSHGYKVGYYTSPYIEFFNERICINNIPIPDEKLIEYTGITARASEGINPIEFEFITAMAMKYFADEDCDIVVLEVGLGGRFDATNIIDTPMLNVICAIGYDHTAILGDTIEQIAFEKAGTIKHGSDVLVYPYIDKNALKVIEKRCQDTLSKLYVPEGIAKDIKFTLNSTEFSYKDKRYELSLLGKYQIGNAICAIEAAKILSKKLPLNPSDIKNGLKNSKWKCRFELFGTEPMVVLDGAHNLQGVKALMDSVEEYFPDKKRVFLFSMLNEKDYKKSVAAIEGLADYIVVTSVPSIRQTSAEDIYNEIKKSFNNCSFIENPVEALSFSKKIAKDVDAVLIVFGSLYLSGMLRKYVK